MISRPAVPFRQALVTLGFVSVSLAVAASAQELQYRDGRFLETLGGVTIQRADEASSDEAVLNMPFLPGDRVWTDDSGRAEIVFAQGEILWIAERSKVDSLGRGGRDQDERLGLRVFAGSFGARVRAGGPGFEFRAPGGSISTTGAAAFRVDVRAGETVVSVSEGEILADLGGQRMTLRGGERVRYADGGVDTPSRYERSSGDRFDRWCEERSAELSRVARSRSNDRLPDELDGYGDELDRNGDWVYDEPQGYVYVPRVANDWAPYTYGRWTFTSYGWTWVANEPWGFVTSHYGRWGYSSRIGWHWMPRLGFSGAWVSWSSPVGRWNNTIGWCALGFNDRPVGSFGYGAGREGARSASAGRGWSFANRADMGRASAHRRRVDVPADEAANALVWNPGASPDREFREVRGGSQGRGRAPGPAESTGAVGRGEGRAGGGSNHGARIYVGPSPGDSTPELRSDPTTTIPSPESRRQRTMGQDGFKEEQDKRNERTRPDLSNFSAEGWRSSPNSDSARPRRPERAASAPRAESSAAQAGSEPAQAGSKGESARADSSAVRSTRDPLLSRFFRSITRPNSTDQESNQPRSDDTSARRREPQPRDDSSTRRREPESRDDASARESTPRERSRPTEARPAEPRRTDENRERARPRPSPHQGSSDERGTRRKPQPES